MAINLFAGVAVTDYASAVAWYERFFGRSPSFFPNESEVVWEVAEHRFVYIVRRPEDAGHSLLLLFVEDLDARVARLSEQGLSPAKQETYANGVRKITYHDADGNEIALGGAQAQDGRS